MGVRRVRRWVCTEANLAKRELSDMEFVLLCRDVMRWIGERIKLLEEIVPMLVDNRGTTA